MNRLKRMTARDRSGFTLIEIALCLAIIGFALVAIIGALPTGMDVQRRNREETIINQDAAVLIDAIRTGARGFDDLTNYVIGITNYWTVFPGSNQPPNGSHVDQYSRSGSIVTSATVDESFRLDSGMRIIGLLTMPKYIPPDGPWSDGPFQSNYVVATVRAMSGAAVEKPQNVPAILDDAFTYRLIVETVPYVPALTNTNAPAADQRLLRNLRRNSFDLRLSFRWPVLPTGRAGNGWQTYRMLTGGQLVSATDSGQPLYLIQPSMYLPAP